MKGLCWVVYYFWTEVSEAFKFGQECGFYPWDVPEPETDMTEDEWTALLPSNSSIGPFH
jgi:hypothetical protein